MSVSDDLPWPELGNVSRGATRGNQGQKGVLSPPDRDGRCILQLRVQPGVLAVRLNRQASEWYRILDNEVNRALKLTKTYWRKARRRQDYDSRADQDHMELHEWLQQLKDKTMSHLELLMQKGDIQGPPYIMPEEIELSFLRKFIERQAAGIPHNPRLRNTLGKGNFPPRGNSVESATPEPSEHFVDPQRNGLVDHVSDGSNYPVHSSRTSPSLRPESLSQEAGSSKQALQAARGALTRAQKETQDAFLRYTACLDMERQARQAVTAAEKRRDDIMGLLLSQNQNDNRSRHSSMSDDERRSPPRYTAEEIRTATDMYNHARSTVKTMEWQEPEHQAVYADPTHQHMEVSRPPMHLKRTWDHQQLQQDGQYSCEDITALPPRKRVHHMMPGFDVLNSAAALQPQNMTLQS
ncbi:hypothetical protein BDN72DRAFT_449856 [Pluteus cervinus]|uniref:Uncharacterized protein n=1 Tax=Pluteus cervinus TaxID=181527 RepID=A0ACD3BBF5_9AGAR|nr:hypothetical protein BDN72DRAFT_449856 [Pluteus cervinus]